MDFKELFDHPEKEEIIEKLMNGSSPKDVNQWLKLKYKESDQGHLRLTIKLLKEFVDSGFTDCHEQFKKDLITVKQSGGKLDKKVIAASLVNTKSYRDRLQQIAEEELDFKKEYKKMLQGIIITCHNRMEQVFDKIQENPNSFKGDFVLLKHMTEIFNMIEKFEKIVNNAPDQIIQHNVTLQTVEINTNAILQAIRKTLEKFDTDVALLFMDSFHNELKNLRPPETIELSKEKSLMEAKLLQERIISVSE